MVIGDRCLQFVHLRCINYLYLKMNISLSLSLFLSRQSHSRYASHAEFSADSVE